MLMLFRQYLDEWRPPCEESHVERGYVADCYQSHGQHVPDHPAQGQLVEQVTWDCEEHLEQVGPREKGVTGIRKQVFDR